PLLHSCPTRRSSDLKPYKLRDISLPEPPEGLVYRNMGTMESSVCDVIKLRMKGRKMSWTKSGANALGKLLALRASGELYETLDNLFVNVVSEEKLERSEERRVGEYDDHWVVE